MHVLALIPALAQVPALFRSQSPGRTPAAAAKAQVTAEAVQGSANLQANLVGSTHLVTLCSVGDSRSPAEIEQAGGFMARAPVSGTSLCRHAALNTPSKWVSTSMSVSEAAKFARPGGWVYTISLNGLEPVSVNAVPGSASPHPDEAEIAVEGLMHSITFSGFSSAGTLRSSSLKRLRC
jgi:hypothetical protein